MPAINPKYIIAGLLFLVALSGWIRAKVDINSDTAGVDVWADLTAIAEGDQDFTKISSSVKRSGLFPKPSAQGINEALAEQLARDEAAKQVDFPAIIGAAVVDGENVVYLSMPEEGVSPAYVGDVVLETWKIISIDNKAVRAVYKDEGLEREFSVKPYDHKKGEDSIEVEPAQNENTGE